MDCRYRIHLKEACFWSIQGGDPKNTTKILIEMDFKRES